MRLLPSWHQAQQQRKSFRSSAAKYLKRRDLITIRITDAYTAQFKAYMMIS
jgi:hypothetical protein